MQQRVAVFVDGENIGSAHAAAIASIAEKQGVVVLARVYGDVSRLNGWQEAHRYKVVHARSGKNATDIVLSLDALELALEGRFDVCIVASSDRDFSHLAVKLRERGLSVIGTSHAKPSEHLMAIFSAFLVLGTAKSPSNPVLPRNEPPTTDRDCQIRALVSEHGEGTEITIQMLGTLMNSRHGIGRKTLEEKNWRTYLARRPSLYNIDSSGALVRLKPSADLN
jgi:hypothetical protein